MLVIRFFRIGKKNQPSFKIVVTDKRNSSTRGRFVEEVGFYNPVTKEKVLKTERIKYWLSVGTQPSPTVHNLLVSEKIIEGKKIDMHKKPKKKEEKPAEPAAATAKPVETPVAEAPKTETPKTEAPKEEAPKPEEKKEEAQKEEAKKEERPKTL